MKKRIRQILLLLTDAVFINLSFWLALMIRFEGTTGLLNSQAAQYIEVYKEVFIWVTVLKLTILYIFKMYSSLWKYASIEELMQVVFASLIATMATVSLLTALQLTMPRSIYILTALIDIVLIGGVRFFYRFLRRTRRPSFYLNKKGRKNVLVIGGGEAGSLLIKEYKSNPESDSIPVAILDDDISKQGLELNGVKIVGTTQDFIKVSEKYDIDEAVIAIPSADNQTIKVIMEIAKDSDVKMRTLPSIYNLADGKVKISQIRDVSIEDLLGRDEVKLHIEDLENLITDKSILVTGGGGSIGSEICRQICKFNPSRLNIVDVYENLAYQLELDLKKQYPNIEINLIIASVRDPKRLDEVFRKFKPQIVFHAAAHKHVPIMENNPKEAVKNNVFGTYNMVNVSKNHNIEKFVMISTDKAVNPTNVMGATKRLSEMIVQSQKGKSSTDFVAVRFGNVLGSSGSVIPLFKKQIKEGGPVTITHEEIIRYFMTIPEAAQLVLQAAAMAKGGEIFILDMGEPVKILDLAKNLIHLSGFKPYEDIPIEITGLRPGEKLYEELLLDKENNIATKHEKIFTEKPEEINGEKIEEFLNYIEHNIAFLEDQQIKEEIRKVVPTYKCYEE
ncbi:MAG: nucleoside-diphosphate sugar epimerase/dehydratase [Bacillota bacterium]|nr:nucleoside-diphosphate sugar epimerase/dehydratase [Bacillota bacterium]